MLEGEQVSTTSLQCVLVFCIAWGVGCTMNAEGRKRFDVFYRRVINGEDKENPKPKSFKMLKNQLFPERGLVFDFFYDKKSNGTWVPWVETAERTTIPANAKVFYP